MKDQQEFIDTRAFAATANALNTIAGGTTGPQVRVDVLPDAHIVYVKVPGVRLEGLKVAVHNNILTITQAIRLRSPSHDTNVAVPRVVFGETIPYFIAVESITASYENDRLEIRLPFNEKASGYHRKIKINRP